MSNRIIEQMLAAYDLNSYYDKKNARKYLQKQECCVKPGANTTQYNVKKEEWYIPTPLFNQTELTIYTSPSSIIPSLRFQYRE